MDASHILRFAFDSADDLYSIGESLIIIEKEKRGVDPEKFMAYVRTQRYDIKGKAHMENQKNISFLTLDFGMQELTFASNRFISRGAFVKV